MGPSRITRRTRSPLRSERELDRTVDSNAIHSTQMVKARLLIWRAGRSCAHAATAGALCRSVFHDAQAFHGLRAVDRFRRACQLWTMRRAYRMDNRSVFTTPIESIAWLPKGVPKGEFCTDRSEYSRIANSAKRGALREGSTEDRGRIWCYWGRTYRRRSSTDPHAVRHASNKNVPLRLDVLGRHSKEAEPLLRRAPEGVEVAVTTQEVISTEQNAPPPNAIKCDVEGAEVEALRGTEKLLRTHHPWIVCEKHSETNEQDSRKFLRRLGYRIGSVESNHVLAVPEFVGSPMESSKTE